MDVHLGESQDTSRVTVSRRAAAARKLVGVLNDLILADSTEPGQAASSVSLDSLSGGKPQRVLSAIEGLLLELVPGIPLYAAFHDGQVHNPLGAGAYAFRDDLIDPLLFGLANDEIASGLAGRDQPLRDLPTRPIMIHAGAQPNNSPHCGTLVVFCYAFAVARAIRNRMEARAAGSRTPPVSVEITFVDTAPVNSEGIEIDGIHYQRSYRDVPGALDTRMGDYREVLSVLSAWSDTPFSIAFQSDFFSHPAMPSLVRYLIANHQTLGRQLSPKHGTLALRAACPEPGCGLAEKHGRLNQYQQPGSADDDDATITFHCPRHGPHAVSAARAASVARLEANAPTCNLLRSMVHLLDSSSSSSGRHHVRVTGADYAGTYQEAFLHRPLAAWTTASSSSSGAAAGAVRGRTPHILYAPLVVDWSGAKLSKSLYVRETGGYGAMALLGTDGLCSYARLKARVGEAGLRRLWDEVGRWVADPRRLFRCWSVEYLQRVVIRGETLG